MLRDGIVMLPRPLDVLRGFVARGLPALVQRVEPASEQAVVMSRLVEVSDASGEMLETRGAALAMRLPRLVLARRLVDCLQYPGRVHDDLVFLLRAGPDLAGLFLRNLRHQPREPVSHAAELLDLPNHPLRLLTAALRNRLAAERTRRRLHRLDVVSPCIESRSQKRYRSERLGEGRPRGFRAPGGPAIALLHRRKPPLIDMNARVRVAPAEHPRDEFPKRSALAPL